MEKHNIQSKKMEINLTKLVKEMANNLNSDNVKKRSCAYSIINDSYQSIGKKDFENIDNDPILITNKNEEVLIGKKPYIHLNMGGRYRSVYDHTPKELYKFILDLIYSKLKDQFNGVEQVFSPPPGTSESKLTGLGIFDYSNSVNYLDSLYNFLKEMIFKEDFGFTYKDKAPYECLEIYKQKSGNIIVRDFKGKHRRSFKSNEFFEDILDNSYPGRTVSDAEIHNQLLPIKYFQRG